MRRAARVLTGGTVFMVVFIGWTDFVQGEAGAALSLWLIDFLDFVWPRRPPVEE